MNDAMKEKIKDNIRITCKIVNPNCFEMLFKSSVILKVFTSINVHNRRWSLGSCATLRHERNFAQSTPGD